MNTKDIKALDGGAIAIMTYQCFSKEKLVVSEADRELAKIVFSRECNKTAEEFIIAVFNRDEKHVFYKYLLDVLTPLYEGKFRTAVCAELTEHIKTYLEEGLTERLQAQLDMYYKIVDDENIPNTPHLYHTMATVMVEQPLPADKPDRPGLVYESRKSMRVTNTIPLYPAFVCSEAYCMGDRDTGVTNTIKELHNTLAAHSDLCFKRITSKYDKTNCLKTAIIHGIKKMLPKSVSLHELDAKLWRHSLLMMITTVCIHYGIDKYTEAENSVIVDITGQMEGTSSFSPHSLASMVLGYNNLRATYSIVTAVAIIHNELAEELTSNDMILMYWYDI